MSKKVEKSKELALTIEQLETAIRDWETIIEPSKADTAPQELSLRAQSLLKKLRQQIDELSQ